MTEQVAEQIYERSEVGVSRSFVYKFQPCGAGIFTLANTN